MKRRLPDVAALSFAERLGLLVDRKALSLNNKRLGRRLKFAGRRQAALVVERNETTAARGHDKAPFVKLATGSVSARSWWACALAHRTCRDDHVLFYQCAPRIGDAVSWRR